MTAVSDLRDAMLGSYHETQMRVAHPELLAAPESAWPYYEANYRRLVEPLDRATAVVDVGCGNGALLAWLQTLGFSNLIGVDASPGQVEAANELLGGGVVCADALDFLPGRQVGLVITKATLEHVPRDRIRALVAAIAAALDPGGIAIVDVPNMDWLLAGHERYMDLTHEGGFTPESLRTLLSESFGSVVVRGSVGELALRRQRLLRRPLVWGLRQMLNVLGEGAGNVLFESRALVAVCRR